MLAPPFLRAVDNGKDVYRHGKYEPPHFFKAGHATVFRKSHLAAPPTVARLYVHQWMSQRPANKNLLSLPFFPATASWGFPC